MGSDKIRDLNRMEIKVVSREKLSSRKSIDVEVHNITDMNGMQMSSRKFIHTGDTSPNNNFVFVPHLK
jgi:hypothetical protein